IYKRLLYAGKATVLKAYKDIGINLYSTNDFYEPCILAKKTNKIPKLAATVTTKALEYVKLDIVIYDVAGYLGYLYIVYFINIYSSYY
ncbi:hypothetical protein QBC39DRAFT_257014, partial [Podospora conica]